jgi:hypothetical protein
VEWHRGGETEELGAFNGGEVEAARGSLWRSETAARHSGNASWGCKRKKKT